jgi:hypothetical protein
MELVYLEHSETQTPWLQKSSAVGDRSQRRKLLGTRFDAEAQWYSRWMKGAKGAHKVP